MLWLPELRLELHYGEAYSAPPDPFAKISNILFEILAEMLRKKQF